MLYFILNWQQTKNIKKKTSHEREREREREREVVWSVIIYKWYFDPLLSTILIGFLYLIQDFMFPPTLIVDELYEIKQYRIIYSLWKSMEVWHISRDVWWYNNRAFYQFPERLIYEYYHCNRISIDWGREKKVPRATGISTVYLQDLDVLFGLSNLIKWSKPWSNYQTKQNIYTPQINIVILLRGCWSGSWGEMWFEIWEFLGNCALYILALKS